VEDIKTKVVLFPIHPNVDVDWRRDVGVCLPMIYSAADDAEDDEQGP